MPRLNLRVNAYPDFTAEIVVNVKRKDGGQRRLFAIVDTGAQISLLPNSLFDELLFRRSEREEVIIEQAGIAGQFFRAREGFVTINLEDAAGTTTQEFDIRVWFADTYEAIIGWQDVLEKGILHLDMPALNGWLDIPD